MSSLGLEFDTLSSQHVSLSSSSSSSASVSELASSSSSPNSTTTLILNLTNLTLTASDLLDKINLTFSDLVDIAYGIKVLEPSVNLSSILPCWTSSSPTPPPSSSSSSSSLSFSTSSSSALNNQIRPISNASSPSINYLPPELDNCASVIYNFSSYLMDNELNLINYNNIANRIDNPSSLSTPPLVHHHHHSVEGDNSSLWPQDDTIKSDKVYWALCLILLPFLAVFGNILVILAVYKEKSLQTVTNYFIVSLAFADLLVAGVVMPFAVYYLINVDWELSETLCDLWVAVDVTCSTASILNLVAISIDRFIAVTRPIKYAKHKSNTRVSLTIAIVWIVSAAIGSPIVFGLNTSPERKPELCIFYNSDFIIFSSLGSFYIPCVLMVFLYYKIFKAIHDRAKKSIGNNKNKPISSTDSSHTVLVIENKSETAKLKERTGFLGRKRTNNSSFISTNQSVSSCGGGTIGPVLCNNLATSQQLHHHHSHQLSNYGVERKSPLPKIMETEGLTNNVSGSIEDDDEDDRELDITGCSGGVSGSLECHIIANKQTVLNGDSYVKKNVKNLSFHSDSQQNEVDDDDDDEEEEDDDDYRGPSSCDLENTGTLKHRNYHGNADSGYGPSAFEETPFCVYNPTAETLSSQPSSPTIIKNKIITTTEIIEGGGGSFGAIGTSSSSSGGCGESQELNNNNDEPNIDSKSNKKNSRLNKLLNRSGQSNENGLIIKQDQPQHQQQMQQQQQQQQQQPVKKRSRFNLGRKHKTSAKRREKASAKRERKATKTLAIVLGVFLICWAPFFTCNIIDAVCIKLKADDCKPGMNAFLLTTWLGYMNSCVNPVIYTIFNPEFRKAFKKIIKSTFSLR